MSEEKFPKMYNSIKERYEELAGAVENLARQPEHRAR